MELLNRFTPTFSIAALTGGFLFLAISASAGSGGDDEVGIASCEFEGTVCISPCEPDAEVCILDEDGGTDDTPACDPPEACETEPGCDPEVEACEIPGDDGTGEDPGCGIEDEFCFDEPVDDGGGDDGMPLPCEPGAEICALSEGESAGVNDFSGTLSPTVSRDLPRVPLTAEPNVVGASEAASTTVQPAAPAVGGGPEVGTGDSGLLESTSSTSALQLALLAVLAAGTGAFAFVSFRRLH